MRSVHAMYDSLAIGLSSSDGLRAGIHTVAESGEADGSEVVGGDPVIGVATRRTIFSLRNTACRKLFSDRHACCARTRRQLVMHA